jgi:hypothetical protein
MDGEVAAHSMALEDRLDRRVDLGGRAETRLRALQPALEVGEVVDGGGQPLAAGLLLA